MIRRLALAAGVALAGLSHLSGAAPPSRAASGLDETRPLRAKVLQIAERAADWQLANPSQQWSPLLWHNAAFYAGVMALAEISSSPRFHDAMRALGEQHDWALAARPYHADDHAVGQTWAELYFQHRDPRMIAPLKERFDHILAHPKDDNLDFDRERNPDRLDRWSWCDALFMSPPAWLRLWKATGDRRYLDYAVGKWWVTSDYLYDATAKLFYRDSRYFTQRENNGAKVFWSRGNGWVLAGLVRMLDFLPAVHPSRPRFERQFEEMAAAVLACQQPDGLWRASLLDPRSFPMKESSGSGFFCYAFAWGINEGLLDRAAYEPAALKAWNALVSFVEPDGKLTHVQPVGFTPVTFDAAHTEPYGVGAFLLAASEVYRLARP